MSLIDRARSEYATWILSVAEAVVGLRARFGGRPVVRLVETAGGIFTMNMVASANQQPPPKIEFCVDEDGVEPRLSGLWRSALKGARLEVELRASRFLERPLELPRQATEFLEAMIRSQLDRLTPWSAAEAVFSWTAPADVGSDRIKVGVIAAPKAKIDPVIELVRGWGVGSFVLNARPDDAPDGVAGVKVLEQRFRDGLDIQRIRGILNAVLLAAAGAAALAFVVGDFIGTRLDAEKYELASKIAARRSALRLGAATGGNAALNELARRKRTTPSAVVALEALSSVLPDDTYATEIRIEKGKIQVVGITQDAPLLVKLLEQSPQFSHATFFAPTTRAANDPGDRFHVQALLQPSFGP